MTPKPASQIEEEARGILERTHCLKVPVPVEAVASRLGLRLESAALGDDVSGVLVINGGQGTIGYNEDQHSVRQRFTIAHELGHFVLHSASAKPSDLFIDRRYRAEFRRDDVSSTGVKLQEIQANRFPAALLMPESLLRKEVAALEFDLGDEDALTELASKFQVSNQALSLRLANLGIFDPEA